MQYQESVPEKGWCTVHLVLFLGLYIAALGLVELAPAEAVLGTVARELGGEDGFFATTVYGRHMDVFPLYPWLVMLSSRLPLPAEWCIRLPAALAVLGMASLSGYFAARAGGHLAGAVAAGMTLTCVACLGEGVEAGSDALFALLISAAWLTWYRYGRVRKQWGQAWIFAFALVLVATFGTGLRALVYFYLPLLFLRRPLHIWRRLRVPGHFVAFGVWLLVVVYWLKVTPRQVFFPWTSVLTRSSLAGTSIWNLVTFPVAGFFLLFPWGIYAWPSFCIAFRPVERTPIFCRFLRTLTAVPFFVCWLLPGVSPKALLPVVVPLSILTGLQFEILLRRYHRPLERILTWLLWSALVLAGAGIILLACHFGGLVVFGSLTPQALVRGGLLCVAAFALVLWVRSQGESSRPYWIRLLFVVAALRLVHMAVLPAARQLGRESRRLQGATLAAEVPEGVRVYKTTGSPLMVVECFYMDRPVVEIGDESGFPPAVPGHPVYVLGGSRPPLLDLDNRLWEPCSDVVELRYERKPVVLWRPEDRHGLVHIAVAPSAPAEGEPVPPSVRMYRGRVRPDEERPLPVVPLVPLDGGGAP